MRSEEIEEIEWMILEGINLIEFAGHRANGIGLIGGHRARSSDGMKLQET